MAFNSITFTATDTHNATEVLLNHLINTANWTNLGTQTLTGANRVNYGGTLYEVSAKGVRNNIGITFFTIDNAGYLLSDARYPCYPSHLNTSGNFIPWNANTPHAMDVINLRVCGAYVPNVNYFNYHISNYNSYKLFYSNTSFVLIHTANIFPSGGVNNYNWQYRNFPRALVFISWQVGNYKYATIFNDFYSVCLDIFNQNRVNMITLVYDTTDNSASYYYNDGRSVTSGQARNSIFHSFVSTGISFCNYPSGAETRIGASSIKLRAGNMDIDMPNSVIFFATEAILTNGVVLDFTPVGQYECYRLLNTTPRYYIGIKVS